MGLKEWVLDRFGLKRETGRVRVIYKYVVNPKYLIFIAIFSLFLPLLSPLSLFFLSSPMEKAVVGGGGVVAGHRRWRRRRCKHLLSSIFLFVFHLLSTLFSFLTSKIPTKTRNGLDLRIKKAESYLCSLSFVRIRQY